MTRFVWALCLSMMLFQLGDSLCAQDAAAAKITYDEHIKPIFRDHCLSCHNSNDKKGGLALDSFAATMEGGSGGEIVAEGDLDSSRLWELTAHVGQPFMPPNQEKLADAKLNVLKQWIETGMLENAGSTAKKKKSNAALANFSLGKPDGELPMPASLLLQPVVTSPRAAAISAMAASPWSPLIAVGGQKQVILYHSQTGEMLGVLPFPEGEPQSISFSRDGRLVLVGGGRHSHSGCAVLFEVKTGNRIAKVGDELDIVLSADLSEDNSKIAVAGPQKMVRVYSTATGDLMWEVKKHTDWIYAVRFSPDGVLLASADRSNGLIVWEADTGRLYMDLIGHKGEIRQVAWRPDGNVLASASLDGTVRFWEMVEGKQIKQVNAHGGGATSLAFAQNGNLVTGGRDRVVKIWNPNGDPIKTLPAMSEAVLEVALTADPASAVGGDWNGNVSSWLVEDPTKTFTIAANPPPLAKVIEQLQAAMAAAAQEATPIAATLAELNTNVAAVEAEVVAQDTAAKAAADEVAKLQAAVKPLKEILATREQKIKDVEAVVVAARQEKDAAAAKLAAAADDAAKTAAQAEVTAAEQKVAAADAEVAKAKAERDEIAGKIPPLEAEEKNQEAKRVAAATALEQAKAKLPPLVEQRAKTQPLHDAAQAKLAGVKAMLDKNVAGLAAFEATGVRLKAEADALAQQSAALEKQVTETKSQRDAAMAKVNELASALAAIQQQMEALKKQLEEKTAAKTQTDAGFAQVDEAMKKLQGEFDQLMEKNTAAQEQFKVFSDSYGPK